MLASPGLGVKTRRDSTLDGPREPSPASAGLGRRRPTDPLLPASDHRPASSPVTAFEPPQPPQPLRPASTGFDLNSSLLDKLGRPGSSERPHRGGGPVNPHQPAPAASHTYLPLGFCLHCDAVSPEGLGFFLPEVAGGRGDAKGPECLLKLQNQLSGRTYFQDVQKPSQMRGDPQDTREASLWTCRPGFCLPSPSAP